MKTLTFRSKVDLWLGAVVAALPGVMVWQAATSDVGWTSVFTVVLVYVVALFPMRYELTDTELVVRAGLLRFRRAYATMTAATPNRSPFSAPALSLDRLLIRSQGTLGVNISPADREAFLAELQQRAPHLVASNDGGLSS
ncbi:MAG: PH domain-containing protein [Myxococcota bacterium]